MQDTELDHLSSGQGKAVLWIGIPILAGVFFIAGRQSLVPNNPSPSKPLVEREPRFSLVACANGERRNSSDSQGLTADNFASQTVIMVDNKTGKVWAISCGGTYDRPSETWHYQEVRPGLEAPRR